MTFRAMLTGMAKPMPMLPPVGESICELWQFALRNARHLVAEEVAEARIIEERVLARRAHAACGVNRHDRRGDAAHHVGERILCGSCWSAGA